MFCGGLAETKLKRVELYSIRDEATLASLLEFIYTGKLHITRDNVQVSQPFCTNSTRTCSRIWQKLVTTLFSSQSSSRPTWLSWRRPSNYAHHFSSKSWTLQTPWGFIGTKIIHVFVCRPRVVLFHVFVYQVFISHVRFRFANDHNCKSLETASRKYIFEHFVEVGWWPQKFKLDRAKAFRQSAFGQCPFFEHLPFERALPAAA